MTETPPAALGYSGTGGPESVDALDSDSALVNPNEDELGRVAFANRIADVIATRSNAKSFVLGIYGRWGEGKSSVLNFIEVCLDDRPDVVCVRFNPWLYQGTQQLLISFFETLARAIEANLTKQKRLGKQLRGFGIALGTVSIGVPGISVSPGHAFEALGERLAADDVFRQRKKLSEALGAAQTRVVVIIDDIDRLEDGEVATLFKIVKLAADFDHVSYVLSFDPEVVSRALSARYSWSDDIGESFLEKIIQVPLELPRASPEVLAAMTLRGVARVVDQAGLTVRDDDVSRFSELFVGHLMKSLKTPRAVKRIVNTASFSVPLIGSEVNVGDLLTIESLRVLAPSVIGRLQGARDALLGRPFDLHLDGSEAYVKARVEWVVEDVEADLRSGITRVLRELFPRIERAFTNYHYNEEAAWTRDRRICASEYFDRYFAYGIPPGDVSDAAMTAFLDMLDAEAVEDCAQRLRELMQETAADRVILKLRQSEADLSAARATVLANVLCSIGGELHGSESAPIQAAMSPFGQASACVTMLVNRVDRSGRRELTTQLLKETPSIPFATELLRWVHVQSQEGLAEPVRVLDNEDLVAVTASFAERLAACDGLRPLFLSFPIQTPMLYQWWGEGVGYDVVRQGLAAHCSTDVQNALAFLSCFIPAGASSNAGPLLEQFLVGPMYALIVKLIDPNVLVEVFVSEFAVLRDEPFPEDRSGMSVDERVAMRFLEFHRHRAALVVETTSPNDMTSIREGSPEGPSADTEANE